MLFPSSSTTGLYTVGLLALLCCASRTRLIYVEALSIPTSSSRPQPTKSAFSTTAAAAIIKPADECSVHYSATRCLTTKANNKIWSPSSFFASAAVAAILFAASSSPVLADEYGVEKEAPTLFTGETVLICTKRGPLGACLETKQRTPENDNDKSLKYFQTKDIDSVKRKDADMRSAPQVEEGNLLVEKLRRQTEENREKNELLVKQKTLLNDQSASFGPFDRQVVIMNADGIGFTLLQNPQAMRLKRDGFIKDRQFVTQPTQEELAKALEPEGPNLGEAIQGLFGGGGSD